MPATETDKQRRWSFAAEARGELPWGTAKRWARESRRTRRKGKCGAGCACKGCRRTPGGRLICR